jgi:Rps23 Pro-64 3,4-dihydroxylase Tpa1-like proline 4-hydroxylase
MVNRAALEPWIQPQHLDDDQLRKYREGFSNHPARVILLKDFLADGVSKKLHTFLSSEAQFATEYGLSSVEGATTEAQWLEAEEDDRFFRLGKLAATPPEFHLSPNTLTYLKFRQTFQRPEFTEFFEALTGLPLGASDDFGVHSMRTGDFLRAHSDDNKNRRIALVIYLSPDWQPSYGGDLHVFDKSGALTEVVPSYNSMVVFDVLAETTHLVTPVTPDAGDRARLTIGGWYHQPS